MLAVARPSVGHRRVRLTRHQTVRTYYRGLRAPAATDAARARDGAGAAARSGSIERVRHVYECPMRWADMDLLGHVNNVVYVDYLQEARVDMLRTHGPAARTGELAEGVVVVAPRGALRGAADLPSSGRSASSRWVTEIRAARFTMAYEIFHDDPEAASGRRVYLRATTVLTPYVFATERPRRLTDVERETPGGVPRARRAAPARAAVGRRAATTVGHYPVHVRFSDVDVYGHVNNVRYFEYYRRRGSSTPRACGARREERSRRDGHRPDRRRLPAPILFRPEPYDCWSWISHVGTTVVRRSSPRSATASRCCPGRAW